MISAAPEQSCTVSTETQKSICKPITVKILHAIGVTLLHPLLLFAIICIVSAGDISSCNPQLLSLEDSFFSISYSTLRVFSLALLSTRMQTKLFSHLPLGSGKLMSLCTCQAQGQSQNAGGRMRIPFASCTTKATAHSDIASSAT